MDDPTFYVMTELATIGTHPEEGYQVVREFAFVAMELADGSRFIHERQFLIWGDDHPGREQAEALVERIKDAYRLNGPRALNMDRWTEGFPSYGSVAYQEQGTEATYSAMEREEDERGAFEPAPRYGW